MLFDCAIIGGGPAGLNAALVLGRARRRVILFDDNQPRNAVTQESHGFITRDGVKPIEFRRIAHQEIAHYPSVELKQARVQTISKENVFIRLVTDAGETFEATRVILATGLREILPEISGLRAFYGKSLFSCPYCDGWELRDQPLVLIGETPQIFHAAQITYNWSRDLLVCTNGHPVLTEEQKKVLISKGIQVMEQKIASLAGQDGQLEQVIFADGTRVNRKGGFAGSQWTQATSFATDLGCAMNTQGGIITDTLSRTNVQGVYAAGDLSISMPAQLIIAAADGSKAAMGVNADFTHDEFHQ